MVPWPQTFLEKVVVVSGCSLLESKESPAVRLAGDLNVFEGRFE
jgi:hypothetical protein